MSTSWVKPHYRKSTTRKVRKSGGTSIVRVKGSSVTSYRRRRK